MVTKSDEFIATVESTLGIELSKATKEMIKEHLKEPSLTLSDIINDNNPDAILMREMVMKKLQYEVLYRYGHQAPYYMSREEYEKRQW